MIPIRKIGKITVGKYRDWNIVVDPLGNEGYIVAFWSETSKDGYDHYYDNYEFLSENIDYYNVEWGVEWTDEDYVVAK